MPEPASSLPEVSPDGHAGGGRKARLSRRHADFVHEHALASVQAGSRRLDFLRRWNGDGAALGAATMLCRAQADVPTRELRSRSTGN
jgi:hypothetical protein